MKAPEIPDNLYGGTHAGSVEASQFPPSTVRPGERGDSFGEYSSREELEKALAVARTSEFQLRSIVDAIPTLAWCNLPEGSNEFLNKRWRDYTGLSGEELHGWGWQAAVHSEDLPKVMGTWRKLITSGEPGEVEARLRRHDGMFRWFLFRFEPLHDETGAVVRWYGTGIDIEERRRTESLRAAEKRTLEMIADGASLRDVLDQLCSAIDVQVAPSVTIATILLTSADGKRLYCGGGPRVPDGWCSRVFPVPVAFDSFCCGAAAFLKERVIVPDVATEVNWPDEYRDLAIRNGIRATWSEPILTKDNEVLGTFAQYSHEPRVPTDEDLALIRGAMGVALIAIERQRAQEKLREDERELRRITDAIPQTIVVLDPRGMPLYANQAVLDYTGLTTEDVVKPDFRARIFHSEDLERLRDERQAALARGLPFESEQRALGKDGQYRWFLIKYNPFHDEQGHLLRWYATGTDIDDRKRAEQRMQNENIALREDIVRSSMFEEIVGSSGPLRRVLAQVSKVAPTDSTVLISGETGTGKELIARAIHSQSKRSRRAFIRVNCGAIQPSLLASELFGHEKGSFTGALQRHLGRFECADGGTIFLDEVGELPQEIQIALLRVLQEKEFERLGGNQTISVDVRVLAATNKDLTVAVTEGAFRTDLFYRLNVFPIRVPALRERSEDIPLLAEYLIDRYAQMAGKRIANISKKTLDLFETYDWPGNIRELQNVIERAVILCDSDTFSVDESWLTQTPPKSALPSISLATNLGERERELIENALRETDGLVSGPSGAAAKLGVPRQTLESKIRKLGINRYRFKQAS